MRAAITARLRVWYWGLSPGARRFLRVATLRDPAGAIGAVVRYERRRRDALRRLVRKEWEWDVPWRMRRPRWWVRGFLSRSAILYELDRNDPDLYVSDLQRYLSTKRMVHARLQDVINNKLTAHLLLDAIGDLRTAELLGVCWRGALHRYPAEERVPLASFLAGMPAERTVFFKLLTGAEGKNIFAVARYGDDFVVNDEPATLEQVTAAIDGLGRPMIAEQGLIQHEEIAALYPRSTNTLRVLTVTDPETDEPFVAAAVQRIGSDASAPVDNWSQGGLSASVDLETGELGRAARLPVEDRLEWFTEHPDTGAVIRGVKVPGWDEVIDTVMRAARILSFLEYVGWDVVVTPEGPALLEANINSGMNVIQVHAPLLANPRVRSYLEERGVV